MMLDSQLKLCVKLQHRGHDNFHTNRLMRRTTRLVSHLPFRAWCHHCVSVIGLAAVTADRHQVETNPSGWCGGVARQLSERACGGPR